MDNLEDHGYALFDKNGTRVAGANYNNTKEISFTTTSDTDYIMYSVVTSSSSYRYDLTYFRLEEEPVELNDLVSQNVHYTDFIRKGTGKNLISVPTTSNTANGLTASWSGNHVTVTGTNTKTDANYGIIWGGANFTYPDFKIGETYTLSAAGKSNKIYLQINYFVSGSTTQKALFSMSQASLTFTIPDDYGSVAQIFLGVYRTTTTINENFNFQLEKGSQETYFEPYGFKDKWYIEKQTGKVVLNGTETGWSNNSPATGIYRFYREFPDMYRYTDQARHIDKVKTDYFFPSTNNTIGAVYHYGNQLFFNMDGNTYSTASAWATWLSTHNTTVHYVLATPTFTEITDENLINQLEALRNAELYEGTTNILSYGNLPAIMNIETDLSNNVRDNSAEPFMGFNITGDNDLISFKVTAKADSNGKPFGSVVKKQLDIEVFNENNKYDLENRQVKVSTGLAETTGNFCEWETFNITQTKDTQTKGHAQYTGYDNMVRATTPYIDNIDFGDSGITLYEFANEVVKQLGSTLGNEELPNGDFIITGNPFTNNETLEVVLRQLGELNGSFVEIGRDNKVWFRQIENTENPMALSTNLYTEDFSKADKFGGVNKVVVGESNIETNAAIESDPTEIEKNGEQLIEVLDNYFMITMEQKEEICSSLWGMLEGFEYYPFKTKYNGFPYIDLGDNLEITDINNNDYLSVVLNYDFTYKGGYLGNVGASALSRTASKYKNSNTLGKQFRKVGIEVNRVDGKITAEIAAREEAIAETKDEVAGNYVATNVFDDYTSTINQTVGGIDTRVSNTETTLYGQNDDGLVKKVETNETNISQNATDISLTVGRVSSVESLAETTEANTKDIVNQFVFGEDGLTISNKGSTSDDMKLNLTNEQIAFLYRNNVVLKINGSVIEFSAASFQKLDLGNYVWQAEEDDSLSLIYEGGNT